MSEIKFQSESLNSKYRITCNKDLHVTLRKSKDDKVPAYRGPISGITNEEQIEAMIGRGSNLIVKVTTTGSSSTTAPKKN